MERSAWSFPASFLSLCPQHNKLHTLKFFFCVVFVFLLKTTTVREKMAGWVLVWALPIVRSPEDPLRQQWVPSACREAACCHLPAFSCYQAPSPSHRSSYGSALLSEKMTSLEGRAPCCSPFLFLSWVLPQFRALHRASSKHKGSGCYISMYNSWPWLASEIRLKALPACETVSVLRSAEGGGGRGVGCREWVGRLIF